MCFSGEAEVVRYECDVYVLRVCFCRALKRLYSVKIFCETGVRNVVVVYRGSGDRRGVL